MPHILRDLFEFAGARLEDYLEIVRLDPICRYFWTDGTTFDASSNIEKTESEIAKFAPQDIENFRLYLADARQKYEIAERTFLAKSLNDLPDLLRLKFLPDLLKISSLKTLAAHNQSYFKSPKMRQIFNRFATYNGSSPYRIPATFALIPHVEFDLGAWYVKGGIYKIPQMLEKLARSLGVRFRYNAEVEKITIKNGAATGVKLKTGEDYDEEFLECDIVISNADAIETYRRLIEKPARKIYTDRKLDRREPSCSGFRRFTRREEKIRATRASQRFLFRRLRRRISPDFRRANSRARPDNLCLRDEQIRPDAIAGRLRKSFCFSERAVSHESGQLAHRSRAVSGSDHQKTRTARVGKFVRVNRIFGKHYARRFRGNFSRQSRLDLRNFFKRRVFGVYANPEQGERHQKFIFRRRRDTSGRRNSARFAVRQNDGGNDCQRERLIVCNCSGKNYLPANQRESARIKQDYKNKNRNFQFSVYRQNIGGFYWLKIENSTCWFSAVAGFLKFPNYSRRFAGKSLKSAL